MHRPRAYYIMLFVLLLCCVSGFAQDSTSTTDKILAFPDKLFTALDRKTRSLESKLDKGMEKYLFRLQKEEEKLKKNLYRKDSTVAKQLFDNVSDSYQELKIMPAGFDKYSALYSGHLDSLSTALSFLKGSNIADLASNPKLQKTLDHYQSLQGKLNQSDAIGKYIGQRQQLLKEQLGKLGMIKELKKYKEQVYYYGAQVREYKQAFENPSKLETKLMEVLSNTAVFRDFFARNAQLGQLFSLPTSTGATAVSMAGLQTRAMLERELTQRFGSGAAVTQRLQQNVRGAQSEINALKDKAAQYSSGEYGNRGSTDMEVPDFKPNSQKSKSFLKRLEWGTNLQTQRGSYLFPITSDIGLSLGYKLNDKSSLGVGTSYKLGWGSGWDNLRITHQGVSLRSFIDYRLKGSLFISGGYEQNYRSAIHSMQQLKDQSAWQSSGLVGVSKKYKVSKKVKGSMQLLWDFLSYQQIPKTQAILFRIGYSLK